MRAEEQRKILTVSQFVGLSRELIEEAFANVWVRGEVSGFRDYRASGHWYFDIKDEAAVVSVAMFRSDNRNVRFTIEDGMDLLVCGRPTIYEARGAFQIVARALEPEGWGALQLAYEQLKARLAEEGLFDTERKRPLPLLPGCVGVVTSSTGAAWRDMTRVWENNDVPIRVLLSAARVQGDSAAAEIVAAIERLQRHGEADVIIVGRGGGSREDLWAFNEEPVARAIAACTIPVVSAVGHEIDQTIADLVADARAATPTAAAELVAAARALLDDRIEAARRRARGALEQRLLRVRTRLQDSGMLRRLRQPARLLQVHGQRLDDAFTAVSGRVRQRIAESRSTLHDAARLLTARDPSSLALRRRARADNAARAARSATRRIMEKRVADLAELFARIDAMSPLAVLGRGYAICERRADGAIVRRGTDVATGDGVRVRLEADVIDCTVDEVRPGGGEPST